MNGDLLDLLLARLRAARDKRALQGLLRAVNEEQALPRGELRVTGNKDELLQHIRAGVDKHLLSLQRLATFVDQLEENGGQHLFLFDLTPDGLAALRPSAFRQAFPLLPPGPTPAMYADIPDQPQVYFSEQPDALVVKQIHAATFWEKDENRSHSDDTERTTVVIRRRRRALNLFRVLPDQQQAEVRIDRITQGIGDKEVGEYLREFLVALQPVLNVEHDLRSTPIWNGFRAIVNCRNGTYMSTDGAEDPIVKVNISNRRAGGAGQDVRDHPSYQFAATDYVRDHLNIYWETEGLVANWDPERGDPKRVHTILSRFTLDERAYGKVYIAATVSPEVFVQCHRARSSFCAVAAPSSVLSFSLWSASSLQHCPETATRLSMTASSCSSCPWTRT